MSRVLVIIDYLHLFFVAKVGKSLKIINYKLLFNRADNMIKHLSNTFILLYILINQILIAQVGELKDSGAFDQACQKGIGPWYFAATYANYDGAVPYDIIDLNSKKISLIDRDGIVCFCEGESKFSGLVTANDVTLYGNGTVERVIVSPSIDNYFNLVFLKDDDLVLFDQYYPFILKDDELSISNGKENLELSIKNITFTNSLTRNESENWLQKYSQSVNIIKDQLIENVNCLNSRLESSLASNNETFHEECFGDNQTFVSEFSQSSIQGNRPNTTLALENVIFKEIDNDNLLEFFSDEGIAILDNIQLVQNKTLGGMLIEDIRNLKLSNIKADRNINTNFIFTKNQNVSLSDVIIENSRSWSGIFMFGNFNQSLSKIKVHQNELFGMVMSSLNVTGPTMLGEGKLRINDFDVSDSQLFTTWFINQKLKAENIFFRNNKWYAPFMFMSSDENPFKFSGLGFENNRPGDDVGNNILFEEDEIGTSSFFTLGISGFGSFNNLTFGNNIINLPIMITSSKTTFDRSLFEENTINGWNDTFNSLIVQVGNVSYINTQFLKNNFQWSTHSNTQGQEIIIIPRFIFYEENEPALSVIRENQPPYRLLENHNISMRNVRMNHSENVASIFAINADDLRGMPLPRDAEGINPSFFHLGAENRDFTIYKFQEIDNIECGFEDLYQCQR